MNRHLLKCSHVILSQTSLNFVKYITISSLINNDSNRYSNSSTENSKNEKKPKSFSLFNEDNKENLKANEISRAMSYYIKKIEERGFNLKHSLLNNVER